MTAPLTKPLDVGCPYCLASPGEECFESQGTGDYYTEVFEVEPHAMRVLAAERAVAEKETNRAE